jgi:polyhydroxyalkanoate synthesis regulator phasin
MMIKIHYLYFAIAIFVVSISITSIQTFAVEEIWEDYKTMGEMVKDIRNGDKDDDKVDYNKFKNSTVYKNAEEDVRNCIDLAHKVGEKLGDYEIVHCFENTNYFREKYVDDEIKNTQEANQHESDIQDLNRSKSPSVPDLQEQEQEQEQEHKEVKQSTSDTLIAKDVMRNNLINELVKTGKFTEDEAKEFVRQDIMNKTNVTSASDGTNTNDTKSISIYETQEEQEQPRAELVDQNQTQPQITVNTNQTSTSDSDSSSNSVSSEGCDPSYPEICITTYSAELICADIPFRNFKVLLPDPHGFDSDADGIGCEE